jgi:type IV pilus assembly protein PilW
MNQQSSIFTRFDGGHVPLCASAKERQRGLTMIELLVAMVISLFIVLAAVAALTVTKRGFSTSQLRDNIRFTTDLMQRLGVQTGYRDIVYAANPPPPAVSGIAADPPPNVFGFNNALSDTSDPENTATTRTAGVDGFGSDVLILRYQTLETFPGSNVADGSMIDCAGASPGGVPLNRYARMTSIIHVAISQGEPTLMCTSFTAGGAPNTPQPIIRGVENFQVLYGVQGVTAGVAPPAAASSDPVANESAPDRYLRADELTVAGNTTGTNANWRNVRSIRIGLVVRGPLNSTQDGVSQTFYPFGPAKSSSTGATGSAMSNTAALDPGTAFTPTVDGRLRQTATFTVHLRNDQGL